MSSFSSICIVCMANYCRSPVGEHLLKNRFKSRNIISAGINPLFDGDMDPRSRAFLNSNNITFKTHTPKKISSIIVNKYDLILAMDVLVLMSLNRLFPSHKSKFKIFNFQNQNLNFRDPYKLNEEDYAEVMSNILKVSKEIKI